METLFVKANDRENSVTGLLYEAFISTYKALNPNDSIVELDLFQEHMPYLNALMIEVNYKAAQGIPLSISEEEVNHIVKRHLNQFLAADKIVFAFPLWNLTVPAVLHTYLDYLHHPRKTFTYTEEGLVGLLPNKKVALLNARGGVYAEDDRSEMAVSFVKNHLNVFGITDITTVIIEGHNQFPDRSETIIQKGLQKAKQVAKTF
ncbi:FMN-dependent NADH-azoreductase [Halalkalibacterium halodurans]|jgi:FMN-dependent NADH-azoreductase|uniref:FMN-dependent NADH-azoreductase n=1 Tax=Halalkalibacterium halodurans TaxID=86665 RepID=UPI001068D255|nr:FMN-dependent NADH-azoreductase [Halalkalibacterium halodurans]MED3648275.1 FMN-dependent NADH-azoreductase [Halalkalibacterium halodurans]MED4162539.1 FMN-dependent NADH-azoreductase [Halalkalibacterium halodurans]TES53905.1 FMN-dependent NADH-azoreductase [Halalkalibacterium halodurans]